MKKILFIIFAVFAVATTLSGAPTKKSQKEELTVERPNMEAIKDSIRTPSSKYYYKKLWRKFFENDTTKMNQQEYRHLYLGYTFQEDYNPYRVSEYANKITNLYHKKELTPAECDTIIKYAELSLADNPFDLEQIQFFIYALKKKKKNNRAAIMQYRLNHLAKAIISTGKGTKESPWVVINPVHEYNILNFMGYIAKDYKELDNNIDYIIVEKKSGSGPEGFYFDVSRVIDVYDTKFRD